MDHVLILIGNVNVLSRKKTRSPDQRLHDQGPHGVTAPALAVVSEEPGRVEMETQTPVDIEADTVPLSLSQRPLPQGPGGSLLVIWVVVLLVNAGCLNGFLHSLNVLMYFDAGVLDVIALCQRLAFLSDLSHLSWRLRSVRA